jgi:hypothetical protein
MEENYSKLCQHKGKNGCNRILMEEQDVTSYRKLKKGDPMEHANRAVQCYRFDVLHMTTFCWGIKA